MRSSSSPSAASSNNNNNNGGRERAIEALLDRDPNGNFYRAARVVVRSYDDDDSSFVMYFMDLLESNFHIVVR